MEVDLRRFLPKYGKFIMVHPVYATLSDGKILVPQPREYPKVNVISV
jgi:hypothetical protein